MGSAGNMGPIDAQLPIAKARATTATSVRITASDTLPQSRERPEEPVSRRPRDLPHAVAFAIVPAPPGDAIHGGKKHMAKQGFQMIDAEMHVMEPVDLWERYIDPEFKARAPRRLNERRWDIRTMVEGEVMAAMPRGDWPALYRRRGEGARGSLRRGDRARLRSGVPGPSHGQGRARPRDPLSDRRDVHHGVRDDGRPLSRRPPVAPTTTGCTTTSRPPTPSGCSGPPRSRPHDVTTAGWPRRAAR